MSRLKELRKYVDAELLRMENKEKMISAVAHLYGVGNERLRRGLRAATQQAPHKRGKGTGNHECRKLPAKTR